MALAPNRAASNSREAKEFDERCERHRKPRPNHAEPLEIDLAQGVAPSPEVRVLANPGSEPVFGRAIQPSTAAACWASTGIA